MADEKVGIKIEVDGKAAEKSVGNIRKEIKEATVALQQAQTQFGDYSQEAIAAAKRVAELRDRVAEAAETAKLFDPGAKFAAFSGALNAVAGGFSAVQGALGLVGVESQDLEKQLLKVQSALALSQGLSTITDSAKDFQRLNAVIQQTATFQKGLAAANLATSTALKAVGVSATTTSVGFKVLRGAIIATGIGALAVGLILLVQNFDKVKKAVLNFIPGLGDAAAAIGRIYDRITDFIGITSEAQRTTERVLKANAAAIRATERELDINGDKYDEYTKRKIEANLRYRKSFEELTKDESLSIADRDKFIKEARERANRDIAAADADRQKSADAANKARADKEKQASDRLAEIVKNGEEQLKQLQKEAIIAKQKTADQQRIKDIELTLKETIDKVNQAKYSEELKGKIIAAEKEKADRLIREIQQKIVDEELKNAEDNAKQVAAVRASIDEANIADEFDRKIFGIRAKYTAEIDEIKKGEGDKSALIAALQEKQQQDEDAVEKEREKVNAEKRILALENVANNEAEDLDLRTAALDQLRTLNQQYLDDELISREQFNQNLKILAAAEVEIENKKFAAKIAQLDAYGQALNGLAGLIGQNTAVGKALAIAAATIDTYSATASQFRLASQNPITLVNPAYPYIVASSALLSGLARVRQIVAVKVPNAASAGSSAAPTISGGGVGAPGINASAPLQPARPQAQVFEIGQQSIRGINAASQRAYVVESDITTSQERVKRLNRAARLG